MKLLEVWLVGWVVGHSVSNERRECYPLKEQVSENPT